MPAYYVELNPGASEDTATGANVTPILNNRDQLTTLLLMNTRKARDFFSSLPSRHPQNVGKPRLIHLTKPGYFMKSPTDHMLATYNQSHIKAVMMEAYGQRQTGETACDRCKGTQNPSRTYTFVFSTGCYKYDGLGGGSCANCIAGGFQSSCTIRK